MSGSLSPIDHDSHAVARLQLCVACFAWILGIATWPLWWPSGEYPSIPWFRNLVSISFEIDRAFATGLALSSLGMAVFAFLKWRACRTTNHDRQLGLRLTSGIWIVCLASSVLLDQQRFQVWAWEFFWLTVFFNVASPRIALRCSRVLVIGIYAYSAFSKFDVGFLETQGPWLWRGLRQAIGGEAQGWGHASPLAMLVFPGGELLVATLLTSTRTRRWGVAGSWVMHLTLLLALGPLGWNQKPGVLLWNVFFLVTVPQLFLGNVSLGTGGVELWRYVQDSFSTRRPAEPEPVHRGNHVCILAVCGLSLWPAMEVVGWCDHWPAWAVYSSRPEIVSLQIAQAQIHQLPASLRPYVGQPLPLSDQCPISFDQWSFEERRCPVYPQGRYRLAIARHLEETHRVVLKVHEESSPVRTTGQRVTNVISQLAEECDRQFWFNTHARVNRPASPVSWGDRMIAHSAQIAVACYGVYLLMSIRRRNFPPVTRLMAEIWTAGLIAMLVHVVCAFHFLHHWSQTAALQHTAQRTAEVTGWAWSGGLYINYAFLVLWFIDVVRVWREALGRTSAASAVWQRVIQGVFLFMMFNATVVFGPWHWTVVAVIFALSWGALRYAVLWDDDPRS